MCGGGWLGYCVCVYTYTYAYAYAFVHAACLSSEKHIEPTYQIKSALTINHLHHCRRYHPAAAAAAAVDNF